MKLQIGKNFRMKRTISIFLIILLALTLIACEDLSIGQGQESLDQKDDIRSERISEDGSYTSREEVALYIHSYGRLPENFISKREARDLGWEANKGNLWVVSDKKSIGGDKFANREKRLPIKEGRQYFECDINYQGGYREAERIVYSNDGLIYYTDDHYNSFTLLYGEE